LFRILQWHYPQFMETLKFQMTSRRKFERLAASNPDTLTDLERAGRFLYLQRPAFGGKVAGRNFGVDSAGTARVDVTKLGPLLEGIHDRLAGVVVECLPSGDFIERYESPGRPDLLGLWRRTMAPEFSCARTSFAWPCGCRRSRAGLSVNDVPELREVFARSAIDALHDFRRQMVRRRGNHRHRARS
jgi:DNA adenine methylase